MSRRDAGSSRRLHTSTGCSRRLASTRSGKDTVVQFGCCFELAFSSPACVASASSSGIAAGTDGPIAEKPISTPPGERMHRKRAIARKRSTSVRGRFSSPCVPRARLGSGSVLSLCLGRILDTCFSGRIDMIPCLNYTCTSTEQSMDLGRVYSGIYRLLVRVSVCLLSTKTTSCAHCCSV